jgi:hypothetical protein
MGSRVMHLIIAHRVAEAVGVADLPRFLLGGVAPDAHYRMNVSKDESHFLAWRPERGRKEVEYERFAERYRHLSGDAYVKGYLTHLIADSVWLEGLWTKYIFSQPKEMHADILPGYYRDFQRLNGKLAAWYGRDEMLHTLLGAYGDLPVCEVESRAVLDLKADLVDDLTVEVPRADEPLEVFTFDEILEYIDVSVRMSKGYLQKVPNNC